MRILFVVLIAAFLTACATQPNIGVGGEGNARASQGGVRVGFPF
jgi:hypothetical protein